MKHPQRGARWTIATNVRRLRKERGLSQEAFSELAGVHRTFVGQIERSETNVSIDTLERVAAALGVPVSDLFTS